MQARQLTILAAVAVVAIGAAIWVSQERTPESAASIGEPLVPGLEANVNEVTRLDIGAGAEPLVTIEREETGWTVAQKSGYPADIDKLRETVLGLSIAEVLEEKTADPENYEELGVTDEIAEEAAGAHLTLTGLEEPIRLIVGDTARGGSSTYVRRAGEKTALLVSGNLDINRQPVEWLRREVLDVIAGGVQSVSIVHPDGGNLEISKETRELPDFTVADMPQGQKLISASETNALASALTGVRLEDVEPAEGFTPEEDEAVRATFRLFDGEIYTVHAFERDGRKLIHVGASLDEELAERFAAPPAAEPSASALTEDTPAEDMTAPGDAANPVGDDEPAARTDQAADDAETAADAAGEAAANAAEEQQIAIEAARARIATLQARLESWLFEVSDYKYEQLTRTPEDLFEPTVPDAESEPEAETETEGG